MIRRECRDKTSDSQKHIYNSIGKQMISSAFDGYNSTIFAYGQTGSGKTYTMIGTDESHGIIPRISSNIFDFYQPSNELSISVFEIFKEKINDLLVTN